MDDDTYYTLQVKGTAYKFKPIPPAESERLAMVFHLSVSNTKVLKVITRVLANSAGPEQWDEITDRWMNQEITTEEMTSGILNRLVKRQAKDAPPVDDAS